MKHQIARSSFISEISGGTLLKESRCAPQIRPGERVGQRSQVPCTVALHLPIAVPRRVSQPYRVAQVSATWSTAAVASRCRSSLRREEANSAPFSYQWPCSADMTEKLT